LSRNVKEAKQSYYDKKVPNSNNRFQSAWNIVKVITGRRSDHDISPTLSIDSKSTNNFQIISKSFNNNFLSIADRIIDNVSKNGK
jgi:hypothetical protein